MYVTQLPELREQYPGKSDAEIAQAICEQDSSIQVVIRYKENPDAKDHTHIVRCVSDSQTYLYMTSPFFHAQEILIDRRPFADEMADHYKDTETLSAEDILSEMCLNCLKSPQEEDLTPESDNPYHICPECHDLYCKECLTSLPHCEETNQPLCQVCEAKLLQALPGVEVKKEY